MYKCISMVWVIITVLHNDADRVKTELNSSDKCPLQRLNELIEMNKEWINDVDDNGERVYDVLEENVVDASELETTNEYWYNISVKDRASGVELLYTIDAKKI